jgi:hypothetical protein
MAFSESGPVLVQVAAAFFLRGRVGLEKIYIRYVIRSALAQQPP